MSDRCRLRRLVLLPWSVPMIAVFIGKYWPRALVHGYRHGFFLWSVMHPLRAAIDQFGREGARDLKKKLILVLDELNEEEESP